MATVTRYPLIRIVCGDPQGRDVRIEDAHTGEEIPLLSKCVRAIHWEIEAGKVAKAHLELHAPAVDVVGELPEVTVPVPDVEGEP